MSTERERAGLPALGMFYCGMGVIVAATILNVAHDRLSGFGIEALPGFLANMYEMSGKLRVTVALVSAGLSIIALGFALQRNRCVQVRSSDQKNPLSRLPYFCNPEAEESTSGVSPSGTVVLQTRRYMPQSSLSGTTGWAATRKPSGR